MRQEYWMRKWYNVELSNEAEVELFRKFLLENDFQFETSDCSVGNRRMWHFEIYLSKEICVSGKIETEYELVENFLENFMEV